MRSYTNKNGEAIQVTQEHLDTAIQIKEELQKASPSRRTSWVKHKRMMETEGFYDSENSENYRQMIKFEQKARGVLPELAKYADMVSDNKLQAIKEEIGEISLAKREAQHSFKKMNQIKRELSDNIIFFEEVAEKIKEVKIDPTFFELKPLEPSSNEALINMSDWHVGLKTSEYDFEIAKEMVKQYAEEVIHYCDIFSISTVHVAGIGDLLNGSYMRPTQVAENEFSYSEQVVKTTELAFSFLTSLSMEVNVIYIGSILGNHSRMYDKGKTLEGDSAENIVDYNVKAFIDLVGSPRIIVDDQKVDNSSIFTTINGVKIKLVHGDLLSRASNEKVQKFISADGIFYDLLVYGHFHHTSIKEENHGRLAIGTGSLQGITDYGKNLGYATQPSQTMIVFEGSRVLPIRIELG